MRERIKQRLTELQNELATGQKMQAELDAKRAELQTTMLRIEGAIQIIKEMLQAEPAPTVEPSITAPPAPSPGNEPEQARPA